MLVVDPDYPQELHNIYNNHILATEKINVKKRHTVKLLRKYRTKILSITNKQQQKETTNVIEN